MHAACRFLHAADARCVLRAAAAAAAATAVGDGDGDDEDDDDGDADVVLTMLLSGFVEGDGDDGMSRSWQLFALVRLEFHNMLSHSVAQLLQMSGGAVEGSRSRTHRGCQRAFIGVHAERPVKLKHWK